MLTESKVSQKKQLMNFRYQGIEDTHVGTLRAKKPWHYVYHNDRFKAMYWFYRNMTPLLTRC